MKRRIAKKRARKRLEKKSNFNEFDSIEIEKTNPKYPKYYVNIVGIFVGLLIMLIGIKGENLKLESFKIPRRNYEYYLKSDMSYSELKTFGISIILLSIINYLAYKKYRR